MDIPEEEIEQAIIWDLSILKIRSFGKLELEQRQRPLITNNGFIDLLLRDEKFYYVVELKRDFIKNKTIVTEQVLKYRNALIEELNLQPNNIVCIIASTQGFTDEVLNTCKINGVKAKVLDEDHILEVLANKTKEFETPENKKTVGKIIFERRKPFFKLENRIQVLKKEEESVKNWIDNRTHDEQAKIIMADLFKQISEKAPIEANQVEEISNTNYQLKTFDDCWFWLFYTSLDKRSNAATFIRAKKILEKENMFLPNDILESVRKGHQYTIEKITSLLMKGGFPLLHDFVLRKYAVATTIIDAAKLISKYEYSFENFFQYHFEINNGDLNKTFNSIREEIMEIHGVGPRMASQFIRGMVLKGNWKLPLTDDSLLEKSKYNIYFAGPARLSLIEKEKNYVSDLSDFAGKYLDGNKAIISHSLWYIRKKYCGKVKHCNICPMASFCSYYLKTNTIRLNREGQNSLFNWMSNYSEKESEAINIDPLSQ